MTEHPDAPESRAVPQYSAPGYLPSAYANQWPTTVPIPREEIPWLPPPARPRRFRRPLAIITLMLVFVGGTAVAVLTFLRVPGPAQITHSYFEALARGDAADALSYGAAPVGDTHLLTAAVLNIQQGLAPLRYFAITAVNEAGDRAVVNVSYQLFGAAGAKSITDSVTLVRRSRRWRLSATAALVRVVAANEQHRVTIAGAHLPTTPMLIFPGAVPVEYDSPLLQQDTTSQDVALKSTGTVLVAAALRPDAAAVLSTAVNAAMTACLKAGTTPKAGCPVSPDGARTVPGSLHGTVSGVTLTPPSLDPTDSDGLLNLAGRLSITGTWTVLDFDNLPVAKSGAAIITFSAHAYVTNPSAVRFEATP